MRIAQACPFNFTGADFYALCADALLKAMSRKAQEIDARIGASHIITTSKVRNPNTHSAICNTATLNTQPSSSSNSSAAQWPSPLTPQYYLGEMATPEEIAVVVTAEDFTTALRELVPSVSQAEMAKYAQIRERFSRSVDAGTNNADAGDQGLHLSTTGKGKGKSRDEGPKSDKGEARP